MWTRQVIAALVLCVGSAAAAHAEGIYFPGTVVTTFGRLTPVEKDNVHSVVRAEQGVGYKGLELFSLVVVQGDTKGYDWNRRTTHGLGARFTQWVPGGMIRTSVTYAVDQRYVVPQRVTGLQMSVDAWFGWGQRYPSAR